MTALLHDEGAERGILDVIVVRNSAIDEIADELTPEHFGRRHYGLIYRAALQLHASGKPVDYLTLVDQLERDGHLEDAGGRLFVLTLGSGIPKSTNVTAYAAIVVDRAVLRSVRDAGRAMIATAETDGAEGAAALNDAEQAMHRLSHRTVKSEWVNGTAWASELYPVFETLTATGAPVVGLRTGFDDLDFLTGGFKRGDLVLLGARPSMGKTAFGLQVALHAATTAPVAFLSVEMSRQPLGLRGVVSLAHIDGWRLQAGRLSEDDMQRAGRGLAMLSEAEIYIDESPMLSPLTLRAKVRRLRSQVPALGLVVVDYLQLMAAMPEDRRENKTNQVAGISRALKLLAREFDVPFLVLSQLNRSVEGRGDKRPALSDLRDSGALEQDADVVLLLHRPEVYDKRADNEGLAEVIIAKHRNGPTGIVELSWRGPQMRFDTRRSEARHA